MAHVIREGGKLVPESYLTLVANKGDGFSFAFAAASSDKTGVVVRKSKGGATPEEVDTVQKHDALKDHKLVLAFDQGVVHEDDQQPFVLLNNGEDEPQIVAFLDGDFSEYHDEGSSHTDEFFCVQKELIPRIAKLAKFLGSNPAAIMKELTEDETYGRDWVNFMNGASGSITLVAATGEVLTFSVAGDDKHRAYDGWWTSNKLSFDQVSSKSGNALDDLASAMAGKQKHTKVRPVDGKTSVTPKATKPVEQPATVDKPADVKPKPGDAPSVEHEPAAGKPSAPSGDGKDYGNPETTLTLQVPKLFDSFKSKYRWVKKRVPDAMIPDDTNKQHEFIKGLHTISIKRKDANKAFLQDFASQEGLSGVNALAMVTNGSASVPSVKSEKVLPKTETAVPASAGVKVRKPNEAGYPAKKGEAHPDVQPEVKPEPKAPETPPQVVTPPLPVMSESQVKQVAEFVEKPETKVAIDKAGRIIADPKNLERVEQSCPSLEKQTANRITVFDASRYPYETLIQIGVMNPNTLACIAFWLGHELQKAYAMMDDLTKRPEAPEGKVQTPVAGHEQAARAIRPNQVKVRRAG